MTMEAKYGSFDGLPARYTDSEARVLGGNGWHQVNIAEHGMTTAALTPCQLSRRFSAVGRRWRQASSGTGTAASVEPNSGSLGRDKGLYLGYGFLTPM